MNESNKMADQKRAERIKKAILNNHTYEEMEARTGIGARTLTRIATGKTEPKFSDVVKIAQATGRNLEWIAHGDTQDIKDDATLNEVVVSDGCSERTTQDHNFVIWNLRRLKQEDIRSIAKQVNALAAYNYSNRRGEIDLIKLQLYKAKKEKNKELIIQTQKELKDVFGFTDKEIEKMI